ncbi:MAG: hypothetical protein WC455_17390 [Dehalococcoidia bacterium]|jgi:hypothetical protein
MAEDSAPDVHLEVNAGLSVEKDGPDAKRDEVTDADDINPDAEKRDEKKEDKKEPEQKDDKPGEEPPADKGEKKVEGAEDDRLKAMETRLTNLERDKKNLQIALHKERQGKKSEKSKPDAEALTDEQLEKILEDNPDPKTALKVTRYMAEKIARGMKDTAIADVQTGQRSKAMENLLLERYPALADEGSDMRVEVDSEKEALGLKDHPYGDFFAVGSKVLQNLPAIIKEAYERGKKEALSVKADEKRGEKIKDADLTPKGKKSATGGVDSLTKEQKESAKQMGLTPSQMKVYANLVGKKPRTVAVEG